jgi:D-alanine-D-alanine ligase
MAEKLRVAVIMGGLSPEHDVSVCTGLEALQALDPQKYEGFPVYIGLDGQWWVGEALRDIKNYLPDLATKRLLTRVSLNVGDSLEAGRCVLREVGGGFLRKNKSFAFDVALLALHGSFGEDGTLQGALTAAGVPFTGGGVGAMALTINKMWTMNAAAIAGVPVPKTAMLGRGEKLDVKALTKELGGFPLFVKPNFLGSSIGARRVVDAADLEVALEEVFRLDVAALVQECIENLVEYNISVRRDDRGCVVTSALEKPLRKGEMLSFSDKYAGSGADKLGNKVRPSGGGGTMAMDGRVLNPPELKPKQEANIRAWATAVFEAADMGGAPRLDFLCNEKTGEIWFNEINPIPGALAYFLWEAAKERLSFSDLLDGMLEEARGMMRARARVIDPVSTGGAIFRKRG